MTLTEAHINFKFLLDKNDTASLPNFEPEEIDLYLNRAYKRFTKTRYSGKSNIKREGFEETQKRTDDLRELVKTSPLTATPSGTNRYKFTLPVDYWFLVRAVANGTDTVCNKAISTGVKTVQYDDLNRLLADPFNGPNVDEPLIVFEDNFIYLYTDGTYTISTLSITYIKEPVTLNILTTPLVTFETASHTHDEIVDLAVSMALEGIEAPRYNSNLNELNKQE